MKKIVLAIGLFAFLANGVQAEDHVMAATKKAEVREVPATLNLSLAEAQDYAVETNRSLRNASLAVQKRMHNVGRRLRVCCHRQTCRGALPR